MNTEHPLPENSDKGKGIYPQPENIEAEKALLGGILEDGDSFPLVQVRAGDFYLDKHKLIWLAFTRLYQRGLAIDLITVRDELDSKGELKEIGGPAYLTGLVNSYFGRGLDSYAAIIRDKATRRSQIQIAHDVLQDAVNGGVNVGEVIDRLSDAGNVDRAGRHVSLGLSDLYDQVGERAKDPRDVWGIPSGFADVDKATGGLQYHQTVMLSGNPGVGKTTLMLQMALNAAEAGYRVAIFEAEMDELACIRRLIEIHTRGEITNRMMVSGRMTDDCWSIFTDASDYIQNLPIHINDDPEIDTVKIRTESAKIRAKNGLDLICLDYVNLLRDVAGDGRDSNQNATVKAQRFRAVCRSLNVAGLTVQSMTKEGMRADVPRLADMSGPAEVHYGADVVFFLTHIKDDPIPYKLLPAKLRHGDQGNKPIMLTRMGLAFHSYAPEKSHEGEQDPKTFTMWQR